MHTRYPGNSIPSREPLFQNSRNRLYGWLTKNRFGANQLNGALSSLNNTTPKAARMETRRVSEEYRL